jgi:glycosyltransferase involved in cell wall biosynthesis
MPKASIIISTYNRAGLIGQAIDSVLKQTMADFEIVVVDDGSTDNTKEIIKKYKDSRIKYFHKENGGISSARNLGIAKATGEYIAFPDDDDLLEENYLQSMVKQLEQNPLYGLVYCRYLNVFPDGRQEVSFGPERYFTGFLTKHYFKKIPNILPSATLFRKSVFDKHLFDENVPVYEDQDLLLRASTDFQFLCLPEILVKRRKTKNSQSERIENIYYPILVYERFYYYLGGRDKVPTITAKQKLSRFYRKSAKKYLQTGCRLAAIKLLYKAVSYFPYGYKHYRLLLKALLIKKDDDKMPDWQMPEPLPPYIAVTNKKSNPLVSVIISTYNRSGIVMEAIESVLKQTYQNFEIIIVDDGSTDNTAEAVNQFKDNRINYFYKPNGGLPSARNFGIDKASGQYITFLDDDDLFAVDYIEKMLESLEKNPQYGVAYSIMKTFPPGKKQVKPLNKNYYVSGVFTEKFFEAKAPPVVGGVLLIRRSIMGDMKFDEHLQNTEDLDFLIRLSCKTMFLCVPEAVLYRRIAADSMSAKALNNIRPTEALILERFYKHLGGASLVPARKARKGIGRSYLRIAKRHYRAGNRKAAIGFAKKAIGYYPFDWKHYKVLIRSYMLNRNKDMCPDWKPPEPLPTRVTTSPAKETKQQQY